LFLGKMMKSGAMRLVKEVSHGLALLRKHRNYLRKYTVYVVCTTH